MQFFWEEAYNTHLGNLLILYHFLFRIQEMKLFPYLKQMLLSYIYHKVFSAVLSSYVLKYQNTSVYIQYSASRGSPGGSAVKNPPPVQGLRFHPWVGKILWEERGNPLQSSRSGKFHGQRSLIQSVGWTQLERLNSSNSWASLRFSLKFLTCLFTVLSDWHMHLLLIKMLDRPYT